MDSTLPLLALQRLPALADGRTVLEFTREPTICAVFLVELAAGHLDVGGGGRRLGRRGGRTGNRRARWVRRARKGLRPALGRGAGHAGEKRSGKKHLAEKSEASNQLPKAASPVRGLRASRLGRQCRKPMLRFCYTGGRRAGGAKPSARKQSGNGNFARGGEARGNCPFDGGGQAGPGPVAEGEVGPLRPRARAQGVLRAPVSPRRWRAFP